MTKVTTLIEEKIAEAVIEERKYWLKKIKRWKQDRFDPFYYETTLGGHPQQDLDSKGDRWMHYQDIIIDHAQDANEALNEMLSDKEKGQDE